MLYIRMRACVSVYLCYMERNKQRENVFVGNNEVKKRQQ